jgi:hypothetical protein
MSDVKVFDYQTLKGAIEEMDLCAARIDGPGCAVID